MPKDRIKSVFDMTIEIRERDGCTLEAAKLSAEHMQRCGYFENYPFDMLGEAVKAWEGKPDFVMLDGNGYGGADEFDYLLGIAKPPFLIALDDTQAIKHDRTVKKIKASERFEILKEGSDRWGHLIAMYR